MPNEARKAGHAGGVISLDPYVIWDPIRPVSSRRLDLLDGVSSKKKAIKPRTELPRTIIFGSKRMTAR
jgi:hypothetical protein